MKKAKNILIIAVFVIIIFGLSIWQLILPDAEISYSERRELAQPPEITANSVFNREFSDKLESYLLDQFPVRESFRRLNAIMRFYVLRQSDSDGFWVKDGTVFKTENALQRAQVQYGAQLYNAVCDMYLKNLNVYYTIVPDKNYFAAEANGYPHIDYDGLVDIMASTVTGAQYIDIFDTLSIDEYYRTDTHWMQQELFETAERIADGMGIGQYLTPESEYTEHELYPFYGVYFHQAALPVSPDTLTYLTSEYTDNAIVSGPMYKYDSIYIPDLINGMGDGYDVFLGGSQPVIEIECPNAKTDRELYIFRDSFGSSLTPLFTGAYAKITVIDLRYVTSSYLGNVVTFTDGADALFINSTLLLNSAYSMR